VFGRVLSKQPGDRYRSCREFIDAARVALGISGTGTQSSPAHVPATIDPNPAAPSGSRAGALPDRYSWSSPGSHAYVPAPVAPGRPPASPQRQYAAASPVEPGQPAGSPPLPGRPRGPRWYRRPRWIAVLAVLALVLAGAGTWAGLKGSGSHAKAATTMPSMSATAKQTLAAGPLMAALALADKSGDAAGKLPPSACKQDSPAHVTCTAPAPGISGVVFQTYPDLTALYAAYTAKVTSLNSGQFRQNFSDCGSQATFGEAGWNHRFQHTRKFTVDQMRMGTVQDDQAAGRVFCTYTQGLEYMAWTQDDGHLMGYVAGPVHTDVWDWWVAVHHNIGIGAAPMNM
jgi:hypothetical protein